MLAIMGVERLVEELGVVKVVEVNSVWSAVCWGFFWVVGLPTTAGNKVSLSVSFFGGICWNIKQLHTTRKRAEKRQPVS